MILLHNSICYINYKVMHVRNLISYFTMIELSVNCEHFTISNNLIIIIIKGYWGKSYRTFPVRCIYIKSISHYEFEKLI